MAIVKKTLLQKLYDLLPVIIVLFLTTIGFIIALIGIDYGRHWDEHKLLNSVANVAKTGILIPGWYNYPSFSFLLAFLSSSIFILFEFYNEIIVGDFDRNFFINLSQDVQVLIVEKRNEIIHNIRLYFCFFTFLSVPILFLACKLFMKNSCSILASIFLLSSFQFISHSLWIAPDALQITWISSMIYFILLYNKHHDFNYLLLTTIICAAMTATKYPAGIFLLTPIYILNYQKIMIKKSIFILFIFSITYVLISPGTLIDPFRFAGDLKFEILHYSKMGHSVYTIQKGTVHFFQIMNFIIGSLFSPNVIISAMIFVFSLIGMFISSKKNRFFLCLSLPTLLYIIYFSTQTVMIVRNFIILLPIFLFYALYTINILISQNIINKIIILFSSCLVLISSNLFFIDSFSTLNKNYKFGEDAYNFIIKNDKKIILSEKIKKLLLKEKLAEEYNFEKILNVNELDKHKVIYFLSDQNFEKNEFYKSKIWKKFHFANARDNYKVISGPKDINLDFYPSWVGKDRIITINEKLTKPFFKYILQDGYVWKK